MGGVMMPVGEGAERLNKLPPGLFVDLPRLNARRAVTAAEMPADASGAYRLGRGVANLPGEAWAVTQDVMDELLGGAPAEFIAGLRGNVSSAGSTPTDLTAAEAARLPAGMTTPESPAYSLSDLYALLKAQQRKAPAVGGNTAANIFNMTDYDRLGNIAAEIAAKEAALRREHLEKQPTLNLADKYRELLAGNKLERKNPLETRALSDAVLAWAGKMVDSKGHGDGALSAGVEAWGRGREREETRAQAEYDRRHKQGLELLGLTEKDFAAASDRNKALLEVAIAQATGGGKARLPYEISALDAKRQVGLKTAEINKDIAIANARMKQEANPLLQQLAILEDINRKTGGRMSPEVKAILQPPTKIPESVQAKLVEYAQTDPAKAELVKQWITNGMSGPQLNEMMAVLDAKRK